MDEVLNLFRWIREKPGCSVTLKLWNDADGRDGFIFSLLPSPGDRKGRRWGQQGQPPPVQRGGHPKSYAGALKTPIINPKTLVNAKSPVNAKKSVHTMNSADAKWSKDARRIAYARKRANTTRPVSPTHPLDAAETGDAEGPMDTTRPVEATRPADAAETDNAAVPSVVAETDRRPAMPLSVSSLKMGDAAESGDDINHIPPSSTPIPQLDSDAPGDDNLDHDNDPNRNLDHDAPDDDYSC